MRRKQLDATIREKNADIELFDLNFEQQYHFGFDIQFLHISISCSLVRSSYGLSQTTCMHARDKELIHLIRPYYPEEVHFSIQVSLVKSSFYYRQILLCQVNPLNKN
jgi:hypothetical protein